MPKSQSGGGIDAPDDSDKNLQTFAAGIQDAFDQLFVSAHDHRVLPTDPAVRDGAIETISIVDNGTNVYLVIKTKRGWFRSSNFTAL